MKHTVSFEVEMDDKQLARLTSTFRMGGKEAGKNVLSHVAEEAFRHYTAWLAGSKRYRSLTEQYIDWIESVYISMFPSERPEVDRLYNDFNLPHGQATYICRVLQEKAVDRWRQRAREELKSVLGEAQKEADEKAKRAGQNLAKDLAVEIEINRYAYRELIVICDDLKATDQNFLLPSFTQGFGRTRRCRIPSKSIKSIIDKLV